MMLYDNDPQVTALLRQVTELRDEKYRITRRALKAETEAATFKALVENAVAIIKRDYPQGSGLPPVAVAHFLQRASAALEDAERES